MMRVGDADAFVQASAGLARDRTTTVLGELEEVLEPHSCTRSWMIDISRLTYIISCLIYMVRRYRQDFRPKGKVAGGAHGRKQDHWPALCRAGRERDGFPGPGLRVARQLANPRQSRGPVSPSPGSGSFLRSPAISPHESEEIMNLEQRRVSPRTRPARGLPRGARSRLSSRLTFVAQLAPSGVWQQIRPTPPARGGSVAITPRDARP